MADDLTPNINDAAIQPQSATVDGVTSQQRSLKDMIATDQYLKASAANKGVPFRVVQLRPGGNADVNCNGGSNC